MRAEARYSVVPRKAQRGRVDGDWVCRAAPVVQFRSQLFVWGCHFRAERVTTTGGPGAGVDGGAWRWSRRLWLRSRLQLRLKLLRLRLRTQAQQLRPRALLESTRRRVARSRVCTLRGGALRPLLGLRLPAAIVHQTLHVFCRGNGHDDHRHRRRQKPAKNQRRHRRQR